ncbi:PAS domain-containing sensor histidine kinase [Sphingomonas glaciei]|uniref:histidine kinase n=1 Tax=Sphingomonas glaciei TaxID=2938948 RepID=A0ABY5MUF2_9SPHN|nr:PAS domain-containing protein [Sphingomonas glaciei]UUR07596.1 PAS domain-containing protein [Sphingomonas glaciei]
MSQMPKRGPVDHAREYWRTPLVLPPSNEFRSPCIEDENFRRLATFLPTLCWLARGDGYIIWYNQRWHDYCGTQPEQMEGWGWQSVHDPEQLAAVLTTWQRSIALGEPFEMVFPLRGADGRFRPFLTRIVPARNEAGEVVRWYGVNTEIGDQVRAEDALRQSESKFEVLTDAMPQMVWTARPDGAHDYFNAQWYAFTGVPVGQTDGAGWAEMFHPDDRALAQQKWRHSLDTGEPYEVEYRLRHHTGAFRWTLGCAQPVRDSEGKITRWIGTCTDIDASRRAAEQTELLGRELSHRIKNIFAVIGGIISITGRNSAELRPVMKELLDRIAALGRAHNFARPHSPESRPEDRAGTLHGLVSVLLEPYTDGQNNRVRVSGDEVPVDDRGATPLSLALHELATNSAKYGALSTEEGGVAVSILRQEPRVCLSWHEAGGPEIESTPGRIGFGTQLADIAIERQLGGTIKREWRREGLVVTIDVPVSHLWRG